MVSRYMLLLTSNSYVMGPLSISKMKIAYTECMIEAGLLEIVSVKGVIQDVIRAVNAQSDAVIL